MRVVKEFRNCEKIDLLCSFSKFPFLPMFIPQ